MSLKDRLVLAFKSMRFYLVDKRVSSVEEVEELLRSAGVMQLLARSELGHFVVYHVDGNRVRRSCLYGECAGKEELERERCLQDCSVRLEEKLAEEVARALESL
ncbi:MAG: hypothetical protein NZ902_03940 [Acidilobaceae archaeon]|nr:hypothetical protein [Acidilobaceae archaeon]MCX8165119.1 hypothetical protein [Acidilobaceae archaeon]MDW7974365.1 hypothetical protein [Sulfolobales archaeon]